MGRRPPLFLLALVVAVTGKGILFPGSPISESKDSCNLPSGATGTCKNINDCQVSAQNMDYQPPKICGYEGKVAVVCCPQDGCMDISLRCASNAFQCNTNSYVLGRCKKTCNLCENGSKPDTCATLNCPSSNAECVEEGGSTPSRCQCKIGFREDGNSCLDTCATLNCPSSNAECVEEGGSTPSKCQCKIGFREDGNSCLEPVRLTDITAPNINFKCGVEYTITDGQVVRQVVRYVPPKRPSPSQSAPDNTGFGRKRRGLTPQSLFLQQSFKPYCLNIDAASIESTPVETNKYPWMALLGQDKAGIRTWFCGGVLINRRWVLTAAHCTNKYNATVVRLGEHDFSKRDDGDHEDFKVAEIVLHDGYKPPQAYHDISLIQLATPIKIRKEMSPVCLPWGHEADLPLVGNTVHVSGWGSTTFFRGPISPYLNEIDVKVLSTDVCASGYSTVSDFPFNYPQNLGEETLCIGDNSNQTLVKDSCTGDSGGPAVLFHGGHYTVVGIVSAGYGCGKRKQPGLYVAVQYPEHLAWIKRVAFSTCDSLCVNGNCDPSIGCVCFDWWSGEFCDTPICDHSCGQGHCIEENVCKCNCPWYGDQCEHLFCSHGNSFDGLTCTCDVGWSGTLCDTIICTNGNVAGTFLSESTRCDCDVGWSGTNCDIIVNCMNDNSSDGLTCTCDFGWRGTLCNIAICNPPCVNGNCVLPNQCDCHRLSRSDNLKWSGDLCHCDYGLHGDTCQHRLQCHDYDDHFYMGNQCFFLPKKSDSWNGTQALCKKLGGFLAEPNNLPNFQKAVRDNWPYVGRYLWVGGRKEKDNIWIWSSDGTKVGNSENWSPAEHDFSHESNDCLLYNRETENFEDTNCGMKFNFACEIRHQ